MELLEHFHAQDAQHMLTGPCHDEEGRAGENGACDKQSDNDHNEAE